MCVWSNPPKSLGSLLIAYNPTLSSLLAKHVPVITRFSSRKSKIIYYVPDAYKSTVRHAENIWNVPTLLVIDPLSKFKSLRNRYHNLILASKKNNITPT